LPDVLDLYFPVFHQFICIMPAITSGQGERAFVKGD